MACLTFTFISVRLFDVIISTIISGGTTPPLIKSGIIVFIYSISFIISDDVVKWISKSVTVKYLGSAVKIFCNFPRTSVPVSPSFQTTLAQSKESNNISLVTKSIWKCHCLVTVKELFIPTCTFVTASLYWIPLSLSLNTPVIEDAVDSIESITTWIAWTACTLTVSSNPFTNVFNGACPVFSCPS